MATTRKRSERTEPEREWDGALDVEVTDPVDTMPKRAKDLPTQNGGAMRAVFAYLLDEDAPIPPSPPPVKAAKKR